MRNCSRILVLIEKEGTPRFVYAGTNNVINPTRLKDSAWALVQISRAIDQLSKCYCMRLQR